MKNALPFLMAAMAMNAGADCTATKPFGQSIMDCWSCIARSEATLSMSPILPATPWPYPPPFPPPFDFYVIGPNDVVTWTFGDGMTATLVGTPAVGHVYATNGVYAISARVDNCAGSETFHRIVNIAPNATTRIRFSPDHYAVMESSGFAEVTLVRDGDLAVESRVLFSTWSPGYPPPGLPPFGNHVAVFAEPIRFRPGETTRTVQVAIEDDDLFTNGDGATLYLSTLDGTPTGGTAFLRVIDDESPPAARIEDASGGEKSGAITFTIHMDKAVPWSTWFVCDLEAGTAGEAIDYVRSAYVYAFVPGGGVSGTFTVPVIDDGIVETDETFTATIRSSGLVTVVRDRATGTIIDDDYEIQPANSTLVAGESRLLTLRVGMPFASATTFSIEVSDSSIVRAPASVTFAAGSSTAEFTITALRAGKVALFARMVDYVRADINVIALKRRGTSH